MTEPLVAIAALGNTSEVRECILCGARFWTTPEVHYSTQRQMTVIRTYLVCDTPQKHRFGEMRVEERYVLDADKKNRP